MGRASVWMIAGSVVLAWGLSTSLASLGAAEEKKAGTPVKIDALVSVAPADWKAIEPPPKFKRLRVAQFRLPRADGDKEDGELVINYFGKGSGGDFKDNLQRWKTMFYPPKGKKIDDVTRIDKMKVGNVAITTVEIHGTYKGTSFAPTKPKPDYRMFKVYFDSKNGPYFITVVGPDRTIAKHKQAFRDWLKGFKPQ